MAETLLRLALTLLIAAQGSHVTPELRNQAISVANQAIAVAEAQSNETAPVAPVLSVPAGVSAPVAVAPLSTTLTEEQAATTPQGFLIQYKEGLDVSDNELFTLVKDSSGCSIVHYREPNTPEGRRLQAISLLEYCPTI